MFSWVDEAACLSKLVDALRDGIGSAGDELPHIVRYVLPDGLWAYSFAAAMRLLWLPVADRKRALAWTAVGPALAVGAEIGQLLSVVPGGFDCLDIAFCALALPLVFFLIPGPGKAVT